MESDSRDKSSSLHEVVISSMVQRFLYRVASWRTIISIALALHLMAVVLAPLASPPPSSMLAGTLIQPFRPYIGFLYLGHGYRFFAPDPGPGHSIRWSIEQSDGSTVVGSIPDPINNHPRLLYHRYFMISEKIANLVPMPDASEEIRRRAKLVWLPLVKGVASELLRRHPGKTISLELVEHDLPTPEDFLAGRSAPDLVLSLGSYRPAEAAQ